MSPPRLAPPEVILTHESDLDGFVSGFLLQRLAKHLFGGDFEVQAYHYQGWKMRNLRERVAWVADFTFETRLDRPDWMVLDHHAAPAQVRHARLLHDPTKSAARLCYDLAVQYGLQTPKLDRIVHLTNLGDLFLEKDPEFGLACDYAALVKSYGFWNLYQVLRGDLEALYEHPLIEVMSAKRRVEDPIGYDLAVQNQTEISPTVGTVRPPVGNTNLIIHRLLNSGDTKYSVLLSLYRKGIGNFVVSFRSLNGEALAVAQKFEGGGGHPNASGATLPKGINTYDDALDYLRTQLKTDSGSGNNAGLHQAFAGLSWPE